MKTAQQIPILQILTLEDTDSRAENTNSPLKDLGTTYSMAQSVRWLDEENFAIGRWDGSLTIFRRTKPSGAPVIAGALVCPSFSGIEMISRIKNDVFASSNDQKSVLVWSNVRESNDVNLIGVLEYDESIGTANDGTTTEVDGTTYFVSGHSNGFLLIWQVEDEKNITIKHTLDLSSPDPIPSPYPLKNIRGVERWKPGIVVTGSEDGDICLVDVVAGEVISRMRYNERAQRGINDIDTCGDFLVLANCSVGAEDKNIWLYRIHEGGFEPLDALNLKVNENAEQVFNFCIDQSVYNGKQYFVAATQEGVIWVGLVEDNHLTVLGKQNVSTRFGAALALQQDTNILSVAGDNIHLFEVQ